MKKFKKIPIFRNQLKFKFKCKKDPKNNMDMYSKWQNLTPI